MTEIPLPDVEQKKTDKPDMCGLFCKCLLAILAVIIVGAIVASIAMF
ncbi:MAG: hypothetical protein ACTSPE_03925 [Candidatus Thorarchaeota archaeon]